MSFGIATYDANGQEISRYDGEYCRVWKVVRIEAGSGTANWGGEMDAPDFPFRLCVIGDVQYGTLPPEAYSYQAPGGQVKIKWEQSLTREGSWVGGYLLILRV